jgi:hypothetical protein
MLGFIGGFGEVEIMYECALASLFCSIQVDGHVEFTPSFILTAERWLVKG